MWDQTSDGLDKLYAQMMLNGLDITLHVTAITCRKDQVMAAVRKLLEVVNFAIFTVVLQLEKNACSLKD